jgi:hypothetical protein
MVERKSPVKRKLGHITCGRVWTPRVAKPRECQICHRPLDYDRDIREGRLVEYTDS